MGSLSRRPMQAASQLFMKQMCCRLALRSLCSLQSQPPYRPTSTGEESPRELFRKSQPSSMGSRTSMTPMARAGGRSMAWSTCIQLSSEGYQTMRCAPLWVFYFALITFLVSVGESDHIPHTCGRETMQPGVPVCLDHTGLAMIAAHSRECWQPV